MEHLLYDRIPAGFSCCIMDDCPLRTDCLRWTAYQHMPKETEAIRIISPWKLASVDKNNCPYFFKIQAIKYAKGFREVFNAIPYKDVERIKRELIAYFGHSKYYRCFRGERLIHPEEQEMMQEIFHRNGFPEVLSFSEYIDSFIFP